MMPGFRRLGMPFGDLNNFDRFGSGNVRPGFNWYRSLTFEAGQLISSPTGFDALSGAGAADLDATAAAAIRGNYGYALVIPNTQIRYGRILNTGNSTIFTLQFLIDPNSITMANNDLFRIITVISPGPGGDAWAMNLQYTVASGYQMNIRAREDDTGFVVGAFADIPDNATMVEVKFRASEYDGADNGSIRMFINNVEDGSVTGLDNDQENVDDIYVGAITGLDAGTTGTIYFDNIRYANAIR
jgi:hypothetical protein